MTDPQTDTQEPIDPQSTDHAKAPPQDAAAPAAPEAAAPTEPLDPMTALQQEVDKWKDLAYRSQAELDNYRKRVTREAQETRAYANADILRGLLPIMDNFEMGLEAARAESETSVIFVGMNMVNKQIQDFLRDFGVQEVEAQDQPFDPNLHDAVAQEPSETVAEGTVLKVARRGFRLRDRLLRAATVVVSSGPPKSGPPTDEAENPTAA